jgi:small GTP-binding protein
MSISERIILRTALCGAQEVGKTSLMLRATGRPLPKKYIPTIGIDSGTYRCVSGGKYVSIKMWDISGDTRFAKVTPQFFRDSSFVLFCFDLSRPDTFETLKKYVKKVDGIADGKKYTKCVVGLKQDISAMQNMTRVKMYCDLIDATYYEIDINDEPQVIFLMHSIARDGVKSGNFNYEFEEDEPGDIIVQRGCPCM